MYRKRNLFISNVPHPSVDIHDGQIWISNPNVSKSMYPFKIEVISKMDRDGRRFEVISSKDERLYFDREDIVENYTLIQYEKDLSVDESIAEIKGHRFKYVNDVLMVKSPTSEAFDKPSKSLPKYSKVPAKNKRLEGELEPYFLDVRPGMGYYKCKVIVDGKTLVIKDKKRMVAICKAYLTVFQ